MNPLASVSLLLLAGCSGAVIHDGSGAGDGSDELSFNRWSFSDAVSKPACTLRPVRDDEVAFDAALSFAIGHWRGASVSAQLIGDGASFASATTADPSGRYGGRWELSTDVIAWTSHVPPYGGDTLNGAWIGATTPAGWCSTVGGGVSSDGALGIFSDDYVPVPGTAGNFTPRHALYLYKEVPTLDPAATAAYRLRYLRRDDAGVIRTDFMLRR